MAIEQNNINAMYGLGYYYKIKGKYNEMEKSTKGYI
jgi:hypothetical protein